jgi:hypothetical protein
MPLISSIELRCISTNFRGYQWLLKDLSGSLPLFAPVPSSQVCMVWQILIMNFTIKFVIVVLSIVSARICGKAFSPQH